MDTTEKQLRDALVQTFEVYNQLYVASLKNDEGYSTAGFARWIVVNHPVGAAGVIATVYHKLYIRP